MHGTCQCVESGVAGKETIFSIPSDDSCDNGKMKKKMGGKQGWMEGKRYVPFVLEDTPHVDRKNDRKRGVKGTAR
jgi:hypothetical protein